MDLHPITEEWLNDWVWPTPFRGPGVDFRMKLTKERMVERWNQRVIRVLEGVERMDTGWDRGEFAPAFAGYCSEGPGHSLNQMCTQLLSVSISDQEDYLDLLRMRARQVWDEVKHGGLHGDVLIRGGQAQKETDLMEEPRANFQGSRSYFGMVAMFPHMHPLARAASNYYVEAGACLGIRAILESSKHSLSIHENLSQYYEEIMHFMEGKYQMDMYCLTEAEQKPVVEALDFLQSPDFLRSTSIGG